MIHLLPRGFLLKKGQHSFFKNDFVFLLSITTFLLFCIYTILIYNSYQNYQKTTKNKLEQTALKLDLSLKDIFDETTFFINHLGRKIVKHNPQNLKFIYRLLKKASGNEGSKKKFLSWTLFDWLSPDNLRVVNERLGVDSESPPNMSHREHTWKSRKSPWTLQMSSPGIGNPSGLWVVPAGMGITNPAGKFLGIIVVGFNIASLNLYLEEHFKGENVSFVILDESYKPVFHSSDNLFDESRDFHYKEIDGITSWRSESGFLQHPLYHKSLKYSYYYKIKGYPYIILTGFSTAIAQEGLYNTIFPRIVEFLFMILFCFIILYIHHQKIVKAAKTSDQARKDFKQKIIEQLQWHIDLIYQYSETFLKFLKEELDIPISKEKQIEFILEIQNASLYLKQFPSNILEKSYIDVQKSIQDAILIQSRNAFIKNVLIIQELEKNLPLFYANEIAFKQIIVSLLSHAFENITTSGSIKISASLSYNQKNKFLNIVVMDNGIGLSEEDFERISQKFNNNFMGSIDGTSLSMPSILNLVKLHEGTCNVSNLEGKGRTVTLKFPYLKPQDICQQDLSTKTLKKSFLRIVK